MTDDGLLARDSEGRPRLLIEQWLPVDEIGIECVRESAPIPGQFPKLKTLHVWWARRPLVASAAAVLGSVMPAWTPELAQRYEQHPELQTKHSYRKWFLKLCGILGDPVAAKKTIDAANAAGIKLPGNGYGYKQAFKNSPSPEDLALLHKVLRDVWGEIPTMMDPTAGGGSIPFEALRYGLVTHANELNPVASIALLAGVRTPASRGFELAPDLRVWSEVLVRRLCERLEPHFPLEDVAERVIAYAYSRTVACPRTGKSVPLAGDWWLRKGDRPVAVRLVTRRDGVELDEPDLEILDGRGAVAGYDPKEAATWSRGKAVSPWDGQVIDGDYIRGQAQAGRMGEVLYAVAVRVGKKRYFRAPTDTDLEGIAAAEAELQRLLPKWEADDVLPTELVPPGDKTKEPHNYGVQRWRDMFTPRQLLVHGCFVEEYRKLIADVRGVYPDDSERADAVLTLLAMIGGKALAYDSRQSRWDQSRQKIASTFDIHAFPFKKTFGEFEGGRELYPWCLTQMLDAYEGIAGLIDRQQDATLDQAPSVSRPEVTITNLNAANLKGVADESKTLVCIDPPYYDNVQYAELSDYFYVWHKRTVGRVLPDLFAGPLTNKDDEAVKNKARFAALGPRANEMAHSDYTLKMAAIFSECRRVLRRDGAMCVMFTHKAADAWNALGTALLDAGFSIETSWPVRTESQNSLHQARQNSANSTILLVCRKRREPAAGGAKATCYLGDIEPDLRQAAAAALRRARDQGLSGVDLVLATYGPALSVLSRNWPVHSPEAGDDGRSRRLEPEEALNIARNEVTRLVLARLVGSEAHFDPVTDFTILAWELFGARKFPFDDARRLAYATGGLDIDALKKCRIVSAASGTVTLLSPDERRKASRSGARVDRSAVTFDHMIDAVHTAIYVADADGLVAAKAWLDERGLRRDTPFERCLGALARALPRARKPDGTWNVHEAEVVYSLASAYYPGIELAAPEALPSEQQSLALDS